MNKERFTADTVRSAIAPHYERYYAKLAVGQSPTWTCDQRTKDNFCITQWMIDECNKIGCNQSDARDLLRGFNRRARADDDLYEVAAHFMNSYLDGDIQRYQGMRRH